MLNKHTDHNSAEQENIRLIVRYQTMFIRQIEAAYQLKNMDEITYSRFKNITCMAANKEEVCDHFNQLFLDLADYYRDLLRERILKGVEFIDSLSNSDPRRSAALAKYDRLYEELKNSETTKSDSETVAV